MTASEAEAVFSAGSFFMFFNDFITHSASVAWKNAVAG